MRKLATAFALASLTLAAACGGGGEVEPDTGAQPAESETSAGNAAPADPGSASPEASASAAASDGTGQTLTASVGTEGDPDAFVITLTDPEGQPVESLPAGDYTIAVTDPSEIHNFHLTGPGGVDESTTVPGTTETTWQVTLVEGDYTYVCDPHPRMVGGFSVTA